MKSLRAHRAAMKRLQAEELYDLRFGRRITPKQRWWVGEIIVVAVCGLAIWLTIAAVTGRLNALLEPVIKSWGVL